jgi:hypothetical protein
VIILQNKRDLKKIPLRAQGRGKRSIHQNSEVCGGKIVFVSVSQRHSLLVVQLKLSSPMNCGCLWCIQQKRKRKKDTLPLVLKIPVACQGHHLYVKNYESQREELSVFHTQHLQCKGNFKRTFHSFEVKYTSQFKI